MQTFLRDATQFLPLLLQGVKFTLIVALGSLALSTVLGLVWALMRVSGIGWLGTIAKVIVNALRGIPILVQLFYIYFVLPEFGIAL
jgi:polar amino acid transport system permease protein